MEAVRGRIGLPSLPSRVEESELLHEISQSANVAYIRAVKRQRLRETSPHDQDTQTGRGLSFLETKWELETGKRRREPLDNDMQTVSDRLLITRLGKLITLTQDFAEEVRLIATGQHLENEAECDQVQRSLEEISGSVAPQTAACAVESSTSEDDDADRSAVISEIVDLANDAQGSEVAAEVRQLIAKQEPNLVRSALRLNSLDGDDAAILSEFLSRAQAKRAANAAMASSEDKGVIGQKSDRKADKKQEQDEKQGAVTLSSPAKQSRRVLEELDVNSPSTPKPSTSTPVKATKSPTSPSTSEPVDNVTNQISSPTIACRRSTRVKPPKAQQTRNLRPAVPNQIPVRRANGTEFVFLQRTEAQALTLLTRKNTRRNKGTAVLPRYVLEALNKQERSGDSTSSSTQTDAKGEILITELQPRRSPRKHVGSKQVGWGENKLVEYAPEKTFRAEESPSPGKKKASSSRREGSNDRQDASTVTHPLPATPSKKVRKINMIVPTSMNNASVSLTDTNVSAINKPMATGTPVPRRKRLTPKLPRNTGTTASVAEPSTSHKSSKATSASAATPEIRGAGKKQSSAVSTSHSTIPKASSIPRSKTLNPPGTSSAGATPMVRRVRTNRAAV